MKRLSWSFLLLVAALGCALPAAAQVCAPPPASFCPGVPVPGPLSSGGTGPSGTVATPKISGGGGGDCWDCNICGGGCGGLPGPGPGGPGSGGGGGGGGPGPIFNPHAGLLPLRAAPNVAEGWFAQASGQVGRLGLQVQLHSASDLAAGAEARALELDFVDQRDAVTTLGLVLVRDPATPSGWRARLDGLRPLRSAARAAQVELPVRSVAVTLPLDLQLDWNRGAQSTQLQLQVAGATEQLELPAGAVPAALRSGLLAQNAAARQSPPYRIEVRLRRLERDGRHVTR